MSKGTSANSIALVGPSRPQLAPLAGRLPRARIERFAIEDYLKARRAPDRVVLCPLGRNLEDDLAFLREAAGRLLWPAPPREIAGAISGLLTGIPPHRGRPVAKSSEQLQPALLLEGTVTEERACAALASPLRLWVVESVRRVRLPAAALTKLRRAGVRWSVLRPVELIALAVSPALNRARGRWRRYLPAGVQVFRV